MNTIYRDAGTDTLFSMRMLDLDSQEIGVRPSATPNK